MEFWLLVTSMSSSAILQLSCSASLCRTLPSQSLNDKSIVFSVFKVCEFCDSPSALMLIPVS